MPPTSTFVRYQLPALIWGVAIFAVSSIPSERFPDYPFLSQDKLLHLVTFCVLALLILLALRHQTSAPFLARHMEAVTLGIVFLYGALDELHQAFVPGRRPDWKDLAADVLGGLLAILIYRTFRRLRSRVDSRP